MRTKRDPAPLPVGQTSLPSGIRGWVAGWDPRLGVLVDYDGNPGPPCPAASLVPLDAEAMRAAAADKREVLLAFERGDPARPVLMGLIQPTPGEQLLEAVLSPATPPEAHVDGKRVTIEGTDEVVLRCGEASITLLRNGTVVIKGRRISSTSRGTHRIRGGTVQIN